MKIGELIRKLESHYRTGKTTLSKHVTFDLLDNIEKIEAYYNSKHTSGDTDALGREKPFFNIVTSAVNIWYRATDIDRKHIRIKPTKNKDVIKALVATYMLQNWMRKTNFGTFLNTWGRTLAKFGSAISKWVEKDGELYASVIDWNRVIIDAIDFENNPVIEVLELTPAQIRQNKGYKKDVVESLMTAISPRETIDQEQQDTKTGYIKVYEIHGNLPLAYLTGNEEDKDEYVQQMHVVSFVVSEKGDVQDFTLASGREEKSPYLISHLIKEDTRSLGLGAVEHLFEAQWMVNHTAKAIKDHLDLASKLIFQTSDGNFVGQNALSAIETGDILVYAPNQPLTQLNNSSHDITTLMNFNTMWKGLAQEITSTPDALRGDTQPAGTAWRQVEALREEAHSLFELMTENKGLAIEEMIRNFVIPHYKTKLSNKEELVAVMEEHDIAKIDSAFIKVQATKQTNSQLVDMAIEALESNTELDPTIAKTLQAENEQEIQSVLSENGNVRFFKPSEIDSKTWKDSFKDFEWEVEVDVTGEQAFNKENLATLSTVFQTIASNPMILENPNAKNIFNKILSITGAMSPAELLSIPAPKPQVAKPIAPEVAAPIS